MKISSEREGGNFTQELVVRPYLEYTVFFDASIFLHTQLKLDKITHGLVEPCVHKVTPLIHCTLLQSGTTSCKKPLRLANKLEQIR